MLMNKKSSNHKVTGYYDNNLHFAGCVDIKNCSIDIDWLTMDAWSKGITNHCDYSSWCVNLWRIGT